MILSLIISMNSQELKEVFNDYLLDFYSTNSIYNNILLGVISGYKESETIEQPLSTGRD